MSGHRRGQVAGPQRQSPVASDEAPRSLFLDLMFAGAIFLLVTGVAMTTAAVASLAWSLLY
jgi:hypothetical protein